MMTLISADSLPKSKYLVFTSAGDHSNIDKWLKGKPEFDLWVVYYGDRSGTHQSSADYYLSRKGSKFQNLLYCYEQWKGLLQQYEAVMVMDDDIVINATGINRLFRIRQDLDLWLLQPAFRITGKLSWKITQMNPLTRYRFTNFVEMACPMFRRDKLDAFMAVYDPTLTGFGTDWWFISSLGPELEGRVAVIDEVTCVNPYERSKGSGKREIDKLQSTEERKRAWAELESRHNITTRQEGQKEFGQKDRNLIGMISGILTYYADRCLIQLRGIVGKIIKKIPLAKLKSAR